MKLNMLILLLIGMLSLTCLAQKVSNFFIFGDSTFDSAEKLHLTGMRSDYSPYGLDCVWISDFRFTNGQTIPELMALSFKLMWPLSFAKVSKIEERGISFASASAGILPETGTALGKNYGLEKQIIFYKEIVENYLRPKVPSTNILSEYLSSSLYWINIGSSDYLFNYLQPQNYNSSRQYNGKEFAELLTNNLVKHLKDLYKFGARKMVIFQIGPLGCFPYILNRLKTRKVCARDVNKLVSIFNHKLDAKLNELSKELEGVTIVTARIFDLIKNMTKHPYFFGFDDTRWPCCVTQKNGSGLCQQTGYIDPSNDGCNGLPNLDVKNTEIGKQREKICENRDLFLYFDELHLTDAANRIIVNKCLASSGGICSPSNILPYLIGRS